jgi:hypothetical protein
MCATIRNNPALGDALFVAFVVFVRFVIQFFANFPTDRSQAEGIRILDGSCYLCTIVTVSYSKADYPKGW